MSMRVSRFAILIVAALAFVAGMGAHSVLKSRGLSLRDLVGLSDRSASASPDEKVRNAVMSRQTSAQYVTMRDFFAAYPGEAAVVMFGDSQAAFADWTLLLHRNVANRAIYGETTAGALLRVDAIIAARAKCVVTMLGIGDLAAGRSVQSAAQDYARILEKLAASGTQVIVQSVLLTEPPYALNDKIRELNDKVRGACRSNCTYVDLGGIVSPGATIDGVHLKPATYRAWADTLKPVLAARCAG